jgi:mRNA-degrading endonuclease toxin of MazEF toxin-antitoxin module
VRRGEVWRYEPVIARAGQSTTRLIVSADSINRNDALPVVYVMHLVDTDPRSLLAVRIGEHGWALATEVDRPVRKRLTEKLGEATAAELDQVDAALRAVFDLE